MSQEKIGEKVNVCVDEQNIPLPKQENAPVEHIQKIEEKPPTEPQESMPKEEVVKTQSIIEPAGEIKEELIAPCLTLEDAKRRQQELINDLLKEEEKLKDQVLDDFNSDREDELKIGQTGENGINAIQTPNKNEEQKLVGEQLHKVIDKMQMDEDFEQKNRVGSKSVKSFTTNYDNWESLQKAYQSKKEDLENNKQKILDVERQLPNCTSIYIYIFL